MHIDRQDAIHAFETVGAIAQSVALAVPAVSAPALAISRVLKNIASMMRRDESETVDTIVARIRMPRKVAIDWNVEEATLPERPEAKKERP